jgi:hypothetical protein
MAIPSFPEFKPVDLTMRDEVNHLLRRYPLEASEYTFTNIFAFSAAYDFKVSMLDGSLIILKNHAPVSFFCPVGDEPDIDALFDYLKAHGSKPCIERVPESFVKTYIEGNGKYTASEERDHFDYIHNVKELIDLSGRKFHDKKNKVNRFRKEHVYEYIPMTAELVEECIKFEDHWCEERDCEKDEGLSKERCAVLIMLKNFDALGLIGGAIRLDNKIAALTLAEAYLPDTLVIHVEKANPDISGLYQIINQEFLMHEGTGYSFVNREQDLGVQGMRSAKMSYNPVRFIKKYRVTERIETDGSTSSP